MDETTERTVDTPQRFAVAALTLPPAPRLGRYVVVRHLGSGGMGSVHVAYDEELHRRVAVKLLHRTGDDAHARARMLREAQALARLSHPNVVQIHDIGEQDGRIFMAMEYVEGDTLRAWRDETRPDVAAIAANYLQAGRGLAAAHAAGLAHRDFKADNAVLGADGRVRVLDFGLARADHHAPAQPVPRDMSSSFDAALTHIGALVGTPAYMSPEQFQGRTADARSDQFSFCAALYEAFYGVRPFAGDSVDELDQAIAAGPPRSPPPGAELPARLHRALLRGLARDPADRWPSMEPLLAELAVDLQTDPAGTPRLRRRLIAVWALVFVAVNLVVLARDLLGDAPPGPHVHRDEGLCVWAVLVAAWFGVRPILREHSHHRAIFSTFLIGVSGMTLARVLLVLADVSLRAMVIADLVIMAATLATGALHLARWMLLGTGLALALALLLALVPPASDDALPLVYPALDLVLLAGWAHASRPRAGRQTLPTAGPQTDPRSPRPGSPPG